MRVCMHVFIHTQIHMQKCIIMVHFTKCSRYEVIDCQLQAKKSKACQRYIVK
jgi:hypothetical protein